MSDLYTRFVANALFPLHERLKGHRTVAVRKALEKSQWWSPAELEALRLARLQALLQRAQLHVPYYRELFARVGCEARDFGCAGDLVRLPFLDKATIRANIQRLTADDAADLAPFSTGGSSGEPLRFLIGKERVSHDVAAKWRATRWWGVDFGEPEIVVWGSPIELNAHDHVRRLRDAMFRTRLLAAFEMSAVKLDRFIAVIREQRPRMLFGYPSALSHIAAHAEERGIRMDDLGIRVAFVTSEKLYVDQRERIGRVFGCRVANGYGGRDAGFIAHECPAGSLHVTAEDVIVEIIGEDGKPVPDGMAGEIAVTHLATGDFPFIRYRTGDVGALGTQRCSCGRGLPVLAEVQGRSTDFVVAQDGTVMHGLALIYVLRELAGIRAFKIVQERLDRTLVQVVPGPDFGEVQVELIQSGLQKRLGMGVTVEVERVAEIKPERSGKFRYVTSHVRIPRRVS